ncbi:MAG: hypothetical protein WDZ35_00925 [Crocinitomicaceae bacterium]
MILKRTLQNWALIILILLLFVFLLVPYGPGITFDSVSFFQAGDHFWAEGRYVHYGADGGQEFAAHRFPLYPLLLSLFYSFSKGAFLLQILLFLGTLAGFRFLLKKREVSPYPLLLLATFSVIICFYCLWTEALYGCLFAWLLYFLSKEDDYQPFYWIVTFVVLLCLTRMIGVVVGGSLFLAYLMEKRALRGWLVLIFTVFFVGGWILLGTYYLGETARPLAFHPVSMQDIVDLFVHLGKWILAYDIVVINLILGGIFFCAPLVFLWMSRKAAEKRGVLFYFLFIHFYAYIAFLLLSKSLIDQSIPIEARTLFPLFLNLIGFIILFVSFEGFTDRLRAKLKFIMPILIIPVLAFNGVHLYRLKNTGIGYGSKEWNSYWFVDILDELDGDVVYTNDQATLYLYSPQIEQPELLPQKKSLYSGEVNKAYTAEMDLMLHELQESEDGLIIWIRNGITADIYPSYEAIKAHPDLKIIYDDWLCLVMEVK